MTPAKLRLYGFFASSSSWRVRIGLGLKGLDYEPVFVQLRKKEQFAGGYEATNAMHQVPTLEIVDESGTRRLGQSMAILEWLDESFPEPPLLPADAYLRARTRMLAEIVNSGIQPYQNLSVLRHVKSLGVDPAEWPKHFVSLGLKALEQEVVVTAGEFAVGDTPTLADVYLVPQLDAARRFGVELALCPTLSAIEARAAKLEAFRRARPEQQPDYAP